MLAVAGLATMIVLAGCKKKEEPKAATMEEITSKAAAMVEEAEKTAETMAASMEQTTCPIMDGNKIDKTVFVEYKGKKVYFCCAGCKEKFEKDPEKYIAKLPQFKQ